jgi:hypothetical protein
MVKVTEMDETVGWIVAQAQPGTLTHCGSINRASATVAIGVASNAVMMNLRRLSLIDPMATVGAYRPPGNGN